ncbi:hypothetical protein Lal_00043384, partial [Lupinus albus]
SHFPFSFNDRDYEGVVHGHDDPLVVTAKLNSKTVDRLFVDQESLANIMFQDLFKKTGFQDRYVDIWSTIGDQPLSRTIHTKFLVINFPSAYNAILGRLTLSRVEADISTTHLCMKFLSPTSEYAPYVETNITPEAVTK